MQQEAISRILNGAEEGFISKLEDSLVIKQRPWALTESIIRSPRNYLAEGGILRVLLLESLSVKDQLGLFYILAYIYGVYSVQYPEAVCPRIWVQNTPRRRSTGWTMTTCTRYRPCTDTSLKAQTTRRWSRFITTVFKF